MHRRRLRYLEGWAQDLIAEGRQRDFPMPRSGVMTFEGVRRRLVAYGLEGRWRNVPMALCGAAGFEWPQQWLVAPWRKSFRPDGVGRMFVPS
jgi:hypothetical protein